VIDFLPEVETARSFSASIVRLLTPPFIAFPNPIECIDEQLPTEIPNHLLYDNNGIFHSYDEILIVLKTINCRFFAANGEVAISTDPNIFLSSFQALQGESVLLSNGNILDGQKQSVRASMIFLGTFVLFGTLEGGELSIIDDINQAPCEYLHDQVSNGTTIELRFASLFVLFTDLVDETRGSGLGCIHELNDSDEELIEQAKLGDVEAAVNLTLRWIDLVGMETDVEIDALENPSIEEIQALLSAKLTELGIEILQSTERFPLLTLAIAYSSIDLYASLFTIDIIDLISSPREN
jgi:hypothetical protein